MKTKSVTVNMKNLLYRILLSWRIILIIGIVFAILGNCYGIFRDYSNSEKNGSGTASDILQQTEKNAQNARTNLSDVEAAEVENAIEMHRRYEHAYKVLQDYLSGSVIMQLDYDRVPEGFLRYYVDEHYSTEYPQIQKHEYASDIAKAYAEGVLDEVTISAIADICGLSQEYAREIVTAYSSQGFLCIDVIGVNADQYKAIADILQKRVESMKKSGKINFSEYDLTLISDNFVIRKDDSVFEKQTKKINDLNSVWNNMSKVDEGLSENQLEYYKAQIDYLDLIEADENGTGVNESDAGYTSEASKGHISFVHKKLLVIGFLAGVFLTVLVIVLNYIFKPVIRSRENLTEDFAQTVLGTVWIDNGKKKFLGFTDRWITKWFYGREIGIEYEKRLDMLSAGIRIGMEKDNLQKLYLTGASEKNGGVVDGLAERLKDNLVVNTGDCIIYSPASLENFATNDAVVFIETVGDSGTGEIAKELELASQSKVKVLGFILQE